MQVRTRTATTAPARPAFDRYASELINDSRLRQLQRAVAREPMVITWRSRSWNGRVVLCLADGTQLLMRGAYQLGRPQAERLISLEFEEASHRWTVTAGSVRGDRVACSVSGLRRQPIPSGPSGS